MVGAHQKSRSATEWKSGHVFKQQGITQKAENTWFLSDFGGYFVAILVKVLAGDPEDGR